MQIQLYRIQMRAPGYGWTTQKVFHLMNFNVNFGETSYKFHVFLLMTQLSSASLASLHVEGAFYTNIRIWIYVGFINHVKHIMLLLNSLHDDMVWFIVLSFHLLTW